MNKYDALEKLLELSEKATPGPVHTVVNSHDKSVNVAVVENDYKVGPYIALLKITDACRSREDAAFIEAAYNAIPELRALLADVRKKDQQAQQVDFGDERPDVRRKELQPDDVREREAVADAKEALKALLVSYLRIVHEINGEHYDPEKEADVIRARKVLEPCKTCGGSGQIGYSYGPPSKCPSCDGPEPVYYTSSPSQQAVDVEGAAREITQMFAGLDGFPGIGASAGQDLELRTEAIIRKHLVSPREGWVLPAHKCGLFLTHNEHRDYYMPLSEWIEEQSGDDGEKPWGSPDQEAKCLATDELWELHWYPETPIGSYRVWAASLEELLRFANEPEASPPLAQEGEKQ